MIITRDLRRARLYNPVPIPPGATLIGTISIPPDRHGALIRFRSGYYAQLNAGCFRTLNQREVRKQLPPPPV